MAESSLTQGNYNFSRDDQLILSLMTNLCGASMNNTFLNLTKTQSDYLVYKLIDSRDYIQKLHIEYPEGDIDTQQLFTIMDSIYPR